MELFPVNSSHVEAIGFDAGTMRVRYKGGAEFEHPATEAQYLAVCGAQSVGKALREYFPAAGRKIAAGASLASSPGSSQLQSVAEDDCCRDRLLKEITRGRLDAVTVWACPKCGCDWRPRLVDTIRHWEPVCSIEVIRVRG